LDLGIVHWSKWAQKGGGAADTTSSRQTAVRLRLKRTYQSFTEIIRHNLEEIPFQLIRVIPVVISICLLASLTGLSHLDHT
jgi:hypothetical protein